MKFTLASLLAVFATAQLDLKDIPEEFLVDSDPPVGCSDPETGLKNVAQAITDYEIKSENDTVYGTVSLKTSWEKDGSETDYGFYFDFMPTKAFMDVKYQTRFALAFSKDIFGSKTESYLFLRKDNKGSTLHAQIYNDMNESLLQLADTGITQSFTKDAGQFKFLWQEGKTQFSKSGDYPPADFFRLDKTKCFFDEESGRFRVFMTKKEPGTAAIGIGEWGYLGVLLEAGDQTFKAPLKIAWALEGSETCVKPEPEVEKKKEEEEESAKKDGGKTSGDDKKPKASGDKTGDKSGSEEDSAFTTVSAFASTMAVVASIAF